MYMKSTSLDVSWTVREKVVLKLLLGIIFTMKLLTLEEIVEINKAVGTTGALLNKGNLEFIVSSIENSNNITKCAATILHDIITLHVFIDGNKRTAFLAMTTFLSINGSSIQIDQKDAETLVNEIARNKYNKEKVENIIKKLIK